MNHGSYSKNKIHVTCDPLIQSFKEKDQKSQIQKRYAQTSSYAKSYTTKRNIKVKRKTKKLRNTIE